MTEPEIKESPLKRWRYRRPEYKSYMFFDPYALKTTGAHFVRLPNTQYWGVCEPHRILGKRTWWPDMIGHVRAEKRCVI